MAQASENVNVSQNLGKMFSAQRMVKIFQNCFGETWFSQKSSINRKKQPLRFSQKLLPCATNSNKIMLLLQDPAERAARSSELTRSGSTGKGN